MKGHKYIVEIKLRSSDNDWEYTIMMRDGKTNCYYEYDGGIIENDEISIYDVMEQLQKDLVREEGDEIVGFVIRDL